MSIKIPESPGAPAGVAETPAVGGEPAAQGVTFADRMGAAGATRPADALAHVAAELRAGRLSAEQAVERVIELSVDQGAAAHLPEGVRARLRAELEALVAADPVLAEKARRLGSGKG